MNRKQLIMERAIELFATRGIEATSVQQITEHCGISKGAFYLSFQSKDELISKIIDYFLKKISTGIDRVVRSEEEPQQKLYDLYESFFKLFKDNSDFAKVFIKEQLHTINQDLLAKINQYDKFFNESILQLLNELYGETVSKTKYDLLIIIKGFMEVYMHYIFAMNVQQANIDLLCRSLVEKTNILAKYSTHAFLNDKLIQLCNMSQQEKITVSQIMEEIDQLNNSVTDLLEQESLIVLKEQIESDKPSRAIINGLLQNLRENEYCHGLIFLVNKFLNEKN